MTRYCALHEIDYTASCDGEKASIDITFSSAHEGCARRAMEVARLLMSATQVDPKALKRTQRAHRTEFEGNERTLEGACGNALWEVVTTTSRGGSDTRFLPIYPDAADDITAEDATGAVSASELAISSVYCVYLTYCLVAGETPACGMWTGGDCLGRF